MPRSSALSFVILLAAGFAACSKEAGVSPPAKPGPALSRRTLTGFDTAWSTETQFIVQSTVTDLAGMAYYAARKQPADPSQLQVEVQEMPPQGGAPLTYRLRLRLPDAAAIETVLPVPESIWAPNMYRPVADLLFAQLQVDPARLPAEDDGGSNSLRLLTEGTPEAIERENDVISTSLQAHFLSPLRHEQSALLLAAFALREHAGLFSHPHAELCRMAAHLAFAQALRHGAPAAEEGQLAGAALAMFWGDQRAALLRLDAVNSREPGVEAWVRALHIRITGDYRLLAGSPSPTLLERREAFAARVLALEPQPANADLPATDDIRNLTDWARILNEFDPGVEIGHEILDRSVRSELAEAGQVFRFETGSDPTADILIERLNAEPEPCVTGPAADGAKVRVIGWGLWASFLQRQLCHAIQGDFTFLQKRWGVPEEAGKYRDAMDRAFAHLRLFPFVQRQNATEETYYRRAQDAEMEVIRHTPHLVPAAAWNEICYKMDFADLYIPPPHAFVNEWHRFNPPPGTARDLAARFNHPSLHGRPDYATVVARLHELAPYDSTAIHYQLYDQAKQAGRPAPDGPALEAGYAPLLAYRPRLLAVIAEAYQSRPDLYESWMTRAATLSPVWNYDLAEFYVAAGRDGDAARAYERIVPSDSDSVRASNRSGWLVQYYERTGAPDKATALAESAAASYSNIGLDTMARLLEKRGDYPGAIGYYRKAYERYQNPSGLVACLLRYERATGRTDYDPDLRPLVLQAFPGGLRKLAAVEPPAPPRAGVQLQGESPATRQAGLRLTDVIVGIRGYQVSNYSEYLIIRDLEPNTPFALRLWRDGRYLELNAAPANNRFGVDLGDYRAR